MPEDQKRNRLPMMIRFNAEERALLDTEARAQAMATGTWIRTTALQVARENARRRKKDGPAAPTHPPEVKRGGGCTCGHYKGAHTPQGCLACVCPYFQAVPQAESVSPDSVPKSAPMPAPVDEYLRLAREFNATAEGPEANALAVELQRIWDGMSEAEQEEARARL